MIRKIVVVCILCSLCQAGFSEFRTWEDREGNQFEAEFVRELFNKVTLRKADGTEIRMELQEFSDRDQGYFRVKVPPQVKISVAHKRKEKAKAFEPHPDFSFITTIERDVVTIEKRSKRAFTSALFLEVFAIAEEEESDRNNYVLMNVSTNQFLFAGPTEKEYVFKTTPAEYAIYLQKYTSDQKRGETYLGYILVLKDRYDNVITTDTNISGDWAEDPELLPKLRALWERGRPSKRCRHFDKTGESVEVPRVKHFRAVN